MGLIYLVDEEGKWKNMCQTREHVCFMQAKASGMKKREGTLQNLHKKRTQLVKCCRGRRFYEAVSWGSEKFHGNEF